MLKRTILAAAIASSSMAFADDKSIIEELRLEASKVTQDYVEVSVQASSEARFDNLGLNAANTSYYDRVASMTNKNSRVMFAKIYIGIYERAVKNSMRLINRIEGYRPSLRDLIKGMSFYKNMLQRVAFYEAEIAKYSSILNSKSEESRTVDVVETTDKVVSEPVLVDTKTTNETVVEGKFKNTYEVLTKTFEIKTTTTLKRVTTTVIEYTDGTSETQESVTVLDTDVSVETKTETSKELIASVEYDPNEQIAEVIKTPEFYGNYALDMVGADIAYEQGYTGAGVKVGIIDTGLSDENSKFSNIVETYNVLDGSTDVTDVHGHGTHVAGIIAADRNGDTMHGVAYNADLVIIKGLRDNGTGTQRQLSEAINYSVDAGSKVTNVSISAGGGYNVTKEETGAYDYWFGELKRISDKDTVVVVAAGNNGFDCKVKESNYARWLGDDAVVCGYPAAIPFVKGFEELEDKWIAVGSVDEDGEMAYYSNQAGVTKDWFMVAPGSNILSTSNEGGFETMSGTSMAAPMVTGAFALLAEKYPHLTATQIRSILFQTATDLGEEGVDDVYGHGLLNIGASMAPVGDLKLPEGADVTTASTISSVGVAGSAGIGEAIVQSAAVANIGVLDSYDRLYTMDMSPTVSSVQSSFSFGNYVTAESNNIIFGLNQVQNDIHSDVVIGYKLNDNFSVMYGQEKGAFGSVDSSAFGLGITSTDYLRLGYSNSGLALNVDYGYAKGASGSGIVDNVSDLHGLGFDVTKTTQFKTSSVTLGLSSPMKVESGNMNIKSAYSRDLDGNLSYTNTKVDLGSSKREYLVSAKYNKALTEASNFTVKASTFINNVSNDNSVSFNYNFRF